MVGTSPAGGDEKNAWSRKGSPCPYDTMCRDHGAAGLLVGFSRHLPH